MATSTTSSEMMKPCSIGFAPDLQSVLKSVFSPMAASAATIRNLLTDFSAAGQRRRNESEARQARHGQEAEDEPREHGFPVHLDGRALCRRFFFFTWTPIAANTNTDGMMASVRVSFTIVAKSPAASLKA